MNTKFFAIVIAVVALFCPSLKAQTKPVENALLWEVSGKGLSKPSYIYGTFHIMCNDAFSIPQNLKAAINKASRVTFEVDLSDSTYMTQIKQSMVSAVPMSKKLTSQQFNSLDSVLTLKLSYSLKQLDKLSIQAISSLLALKVLPCAETKSYEAELLKLAKEQNKTIGGLETVKFQMECYTKAYSDQYMFNQTLHMDNMATDLDTMMAMYNKQDINGLYNYTTDNAHTEPQTEKWLLQTRNTNWAELMPTLMQKESNVFAVGSAHLAGKTGIITLLRAQGYTVKPLYK